MNGSDCRMRLYIRNIGAETQGGITPEFADRDHDRQSVHCMRNGLRVDQDIVWYCNDMHSHPTLTRDPYIIRHCSS